MVNIVQTVEKRDVMNKNKFLVSNFFIVLVICLVTLLIPVETQNKTGFLIVFIYYLFFNILSSFIIFISLCNDLKKDVLNLSVIYVYVILNIISVIFLFISKVFFIKTQLLLIFVLLLLLTSFLIFYYLINANKYICKHDENIKDKIKIVNNWRDRIEILVKNCHDENIKLKLNNLFELVKYMDSIDNNMTKELDEQINDLICKLEDELNIMYIDELIKILDKRKVIIKNKN